MGADWMLSAPVVGALCIGLGCQLAVWDYWPAVLLWSGQALFLPALLGALLVKKWASGFSRPLNEH